MEKKSKSCIYANLLDCEYCKELNNEIKILKEKVSDLEKDVETKDDANEELRIKIDKIFNLSKDMKYYAVAIEIEAGA